MKHIKERCMWFIGANRMQGTNYKEFMYSEIDIILFNYTSNYEIDNQSKPMVVDVDYTVAKHRLKEM